MNFNKQKIGTIIENSVSAEKEPFFTDEQIEKFKTAGEIVLALIAVGGLITLAAVAPNAVQVFGKSLHRKNPYRKFTRKEKIRKVTETFYYLKRSGYIKMRPTGKDFKIFLTNFGRKRLKKLEFKTLTIPRAKNGIGSGGKLPQISQQKNTNGLLIFFGKNSKT